jgi:hypothetical protein
MAPFVINPNFLALLVEPLMAVLLALMAYLLARAMTDSVRAAIGRIT